MALGCTREHSEMHCASDMDGKYTTCHLNVDVEPPCPSIMLSYVCHKGGFPSLRHNEIRDLSASLLKEVCSNTGTELHLQPLNGETFKCHG
jgi:hypothetical protein